MMAEPDEPPVLLWMHSKTAADRYGDALVTPSGAVIIVHDTMAPDIESTEPSVETIRYLIRAHETRAIYTAIAKNKRRLQGGKAR